MIVDQSVVIQAPAERAWALLMDIPAVATCVPGIEGVAPSGDGLWTGIIGVKVGPIGVRLEGQVRVAERDDAARRARFDVEGTDRRIRGAVNAKTSLAVEDLGNGTCRLDIHTDASILGKLGQFGQAVMKKKADQLLGEFAANIGTKLAAA